MNAVNPGHTETEGAVGSGAFDGEARQRLVASTPMGRSGQPSDIAPAVVFLASDEAAWITGETIRGAGAK